ncbi:unnamed protein product [Porites evermanni]|uniref:HNH nuclease domain-containing protein n=1 Tax=Porites evermanni TaxID=104178 RepID=A0ABN8M778_9CNID|nr:unnamed protein product [Porites evermanni]
MNRKKILNGGKSYYIHPIFTNYAASKDGEILNGYYQFKMSDKNLIKPKTYYIHRFEWECVRGVIPEGFVIDHIDSVKTNNKIENLQLLSQKVLEKEIVNLYYHLILKITNKKIMKVLILLHSN